MPRSAELSASCVLLAACALLGLLGPTLLRQLTGMTAAMLRTAGQVPPGGGWVPAGALQAAGPAAATVAILLGGICVGAFLAGVAQVGLRVVGDRCRLDVGRLSVAQGMRRMFSGRGCVRAVMSVCKLAAVAAVGLGTIRSFVPRMAASAGAAPAGIMTVAGRMLGAVAIRVGLVLLALAAIDYLYQRWEHRRELRMTRRELTEELKETEGDPGPLRRSGRGGCEGPTTPKRRRRAGGRAVERLREI